MQMFEVKIQYEKFIEEKAKMGKETEIYLLDAFTYTEAEAEATKIINDNTYMENAVIKSMKPVSMNEIFRKNNEDADEDKKWYKCKVMISDIDTGKKHKNIMLVLGDSLANAVSELKTYMADTMADWDSVSVEETKIGRIIQK